MKTHHRLFLLIVTSLLGVNLASANQQQVSGVNASASDTRVYYLVRHAEKRKDGSKNPHLTQQGQQRANNLAQQLLLAGITHIYSTDYHRTQQTAKPLADLLGLEVQTYNPSNLQELAARLKAQVNTKSKTQAALIVGHSNTTPQLTSLLSGQAVPDMDESEYTNLYQVVIINGKAVVNRLSTPPFNAKTALTEQ